MDENPESGHEIKYFLIINTEKAMAAQMTAMNITKIYNSIQNEKIEKTLKRTSYNICPHYQETHLCLMNLQNTQ